MNPTDYPRLMLGCLYYHPHLRGEGPGSKWFAYFGGDYSKAYQAIMSLNGEVDHALFLEKFTGNEAFILRLSEEVPKTQPENFYIYYREAQLTLCCKKLVREGEKYEKSGRLGKDNIIQAAQSLTRAFESGSLLDAEIADLSTLEEKLPRYAWKGWLPRSKISLLAGDPGEGKSYLSLDVAARISRGDGFPDCEDKTLRGDVLIFSAEDDIQDTILLRLNLLGADLSRIHVFQGFKGSGSRQWDIRDIPTLRKITTPYPELRMIIADPIHSFMGDTKENSNNAIRNAIEPARLFALETDIAFLLLLHRAKSSDYRSALLSIMGSVAWSALSRSVMAIGRDKEDPELRHLMSLKASLTRRPDSLSFRITDDGIEWEDSRQSVDVDREDVLNPQPDKTRKRLPSPLVQKTMQFIYDALIEGPLPVKEIYALGEKADLTSQQLDRAAGVMAKDSRLGFKRQGDVSEGESFSTWELLGV